MSVTKFPRSFIKQPGQFSLEAVRNPIYDNDQVLCCWCEQSKFGGIYFIALQTWHLTGPHESIEGYQHHLMRLFPDVAKKFMEKD